MKPSQYIDLSIPKNKRYAFLQARRFAGPFFFLRGPKAQHTQEEEDLLMRYAKNAESIVEIGVAEGACARAIASIVSATAEIHLIDPYISKGMLGLNWHKIAASYFVAQSKHLNIQWHYSTSSDVAKNWSKKVDLLIIDGDHSYEGCLDDWNTWSAFVSDGGHVVFHDARVFEDGWTTQDSGPVQVIAELEKFQQSQWNIAEQLHSCVVLQRCRVKES